MLAVTGRRMSEIHDEIHSEFGNLNMEECNCTFRPELKAGLVKRLMEDKEVPDLPFDTDKVSYLDGCKVYFKCGGWVCTRFSGTEPLLRIFCEMPEKDQAKEVCAIYKKYFDL